MRTPRQSSRAARRVDEVLDPVRRSPPTRRGAFLCPWARPRPTPYRASRWAGRLPQRHAHDVERAEQRAGVLRHAVDGRAAPPAGTARACASWRAAWPRLRPRSTRAMATALRSPSVSRNTLASRSTRLGGGSSATKWRASLRGDVARRCRVFREVGERASALLDAARRVDLAEQVCVARLVPRWERTRTSPGSPRRPRDRKGPAGDDARQRGHVGLRVAAVHAQRMQLEDLARQVLVEAAIAVSPGRRVRAERQRVVEIGQHGGMALDGPQHG